MLRRKASTMGANPNALPVSVWRSARAAISAMASRSSAMRSAMSGRWTLTATVRPSARRARWTCPSDAEASGSGSNSANTVPIGAANSASTTATMSA